MINVQDRLSAWIPHVQGRYINEDGAYGAQCWDLGAHWSRFLGLPVINTGYPGRWVGWAGNMVDAFPQTAEIAAAYTLHGPNEKGQPGDIVVWDDSYWYYPATHVAVLIADKGNQLQCMSQNSTPSRPDNPYPGQSSGPTTIQSLPRQGLLGFIRPRTSINLASAGATDIEEYEVITEADVQKIAERVRDLLMTDNKGGNTLGELIAEERDHHLQVIETIGKATTNPMIHPVQAEGIVSSTVERVSAKLDGRTIDAGQADDIAQAAARYNQKHDADLYKDGEPA
ncbi:hypothetical protein ACLKOZ_17125 [Arthrobacter sp. R4]|uniref:hypothetical protein n=1 Tax=Arthrobacter sp. R4 TaxID=644417 RepID=UPI003ED9DE27